MHSGTVKRKESVGLLCDVCGEIAAVSPEETSTSQCERISESFVARQSITFDIDVLAVAPGSSAVILKQ